MPVIILKIKQSINLQRYLRQENVSSLFFPQYQPGEVLDRAREGGFHTLVMEMMFGALFDLKPHLSSSAVERSLTRASNVSSRRPNQADACILKF